MNDATIVTAFYDIGRSSWESSMFRRSSEEYIQAFSNLLKFDYPIVLFVDSRHHDRVMDLITSSRRANDSSIRVISIDEEWLKRNVWAWSRLDREREIMQSEQYRSLIPHRVAIQYPENVKPEYTILTHSKIDFLNYVIENKIVDSKFFVWLDFGFLSSKAMTMCSPRKNLDASKMLEGKVILCCLNGGVTMQDTDIIYTLKTAPEKIAAGLFIGDANSIKKFRSMCHEWLIRYQSMNIADDEQALWIQCLLQDQQLFSMHIFSGWYDSINYFTKD